jgi:hypothetical protein
MVLVLTLHQLSAINCAACKRSAFASTSLAAADDVSTFFFYFFEDVVYQLGATQVFTFVMAPMSTGSTKNVVLGDTNSKLDIFRTI